MIHSLTFVTGNPDKAKLLSEYVDVPVLHKKIDLIEIQSLDLEEIVAYKVKEAYRHVLSPVVVEDTSLQFVALGRLPGPLIKWFLTELGTSGLCRLLDQSMDRSALATVQFGVYDGQAFQTFTSTREGAIAPEPRGTHGFGWDSIFIPKGYTKTWAEMTPDEIRETSLRLPALKQLEMYIQQKYKE